ncbi:hypothetical protein EPUS_01514 [Endocarpon pusillum Z07020]|uniref:PH domain-containing protein n=1 Tax=Endocarpon pusillum (strain Z07020 / HMAS-L-300199) TaxID=1263415 RepID=U1HXY6_ENDPU|nr:uncharacterized protein EPUS_01514 [Endocarpon pusillum Z07020]ERF75685.1 hypothetical protein EPUS_01514 [Endocarpon pusillum Z07020]
MGRNRSHGALSPTPPRSVATAKEAPTPRPKPPDSMSRSESTLLLPGIARRQSKAGLRELFSQNRPTRTLATTSESNQTLSDNHTNILSTKNIDASWAPPPLFQAYHQSLKHISLEASTLSAPSIIRLNEQRSTTRPHNSVQNTPSIPADSTSTPRRPRRISASVANAEWTRKVYVLTTSGQLLQYAGEGAFDRRPEKILQLGKDSAAFASDAIEGRHFVLHVSQSCSDDGEADLNSSKGILSRIGIRTASARRSAKVLLMVFETPEDLDSWLSALRKMIGSLGGRPYSPEIFSFGPKPSAQPAVSQRYLVQKDACQLSQELGSAESMEIAIEERLSTKSSTYSATDLERLRNSKHSNTSFVAETPTSLLDSAPSSPAQEKFAMTEVPYLELPDLGPTSLVDFSQHGKRQSRLSLMFAEITRRSSIDAKPTVARNSRQGSLQARPAARRNSSMPQIEQDMDQGSDQIAEEVQQHGAPPKDQNTQMDERRVSTVAPLSTLLSLRHTAPELPSNLFSSTSESIRQLPKRYSSLEYSRSFRQSHLPTMALFKPPSLDIDVRRPASMQLQAEPMSVTQIPARPQSRYSSARECTRPAEAIQKHRIDVRFSVEACKRNVNTTFGPPAGPPPSCPLPAVPRAALPLRRQSLAAKDITLPQSWVKKASDFF